MPKLKRQTPLKGGRENIWGSIDPPLRKWAEKQRDMFGDSLSFVVNCALSFTSGIPLMVDKLSRKHHIVRRTRIIRFQEAKQQLRKRA